LCSDGPNTFSLFVLGAPITRFECLTFDRMIIYIIIRYIF